jgi:hypothetical protein
MSMFCFGCKTDIAHRSFIEVKLIGRPPNRHIKGDRPTLTLCQFHSFKCLKRWMRRMKADANPRVNMLPREVAEAIREVAEQ